MQRAVRTLAGVGFASLAFYSVREDVLPHALAGSPSGTLYGFGASVRGELGTSAKKVFRPAVCEALRVQDIAMVSSRGQSTAVLTKSGDVYVCGSGRNGRLGLASQSDVQRPQLLASLKQFGKAKFVSVGDMHMAAIMEDGRVVTWGNNHSGQCGAVSTDSGPREVPELAGATSIACGTSHTLAVVDGKAYACGDGKRGALGLGRSVAAQTVPAEVSALTQVVSVAAGRDFSLFVDAAGAVYACGDSSRDQLGLTAATLSVMEPQQVASLASERIVQVAAGEFHAVALTQDGRCFAWGQNRQGELGHGDTNDAATPEPVNGLEGHKIVQVACGANHTVFLTEKGDVFACGRAKYGQLGAGGSARSALPLRVEMPHDGTATHVAAGTDHSLVVAVE